MSKELEALKIGIPKLKKLYENSAKKMSQNDILGFDLVFVYLDKALKRLESIESSKPNEALSYIDAFIEENNNDIKNQNITGFDIDTQAKWVKYLEHKSFMFSTIKQALLKGQEQEKLIIELCEYCGMDNLYPYDNLNEIEIAFKDTFDNYQRQRIESLGRLNKQQKVLQILKEKRVDLSYLRCCFEDNQSVERYNEYIRDKTMTYDHEEELTEKEFDTLKRWIENE